MEKGIRIVGAPTLLEMAMILEPFGDDLPQEETEPRGKNSPAEAPSAHERQGDS
jgi:hypothetical protein